RRQGRGAGATSCRRRPATRSSAVGCCASCPPRACACRSGLIACMASTRPSFCAVCACSTGRSERRSSTSALQPVSGTSSRARRDGSAASIPYATLRSSRSPGAPREWSHPQQITARYGGPLRDMVASRTWSMGEWTDDTAMAIALAESLAERGGYDEDDVLARYLVWSRSSPKDIGATVSHALARARTPDDARAAAKAYHQASGGRSAGNGSLMRTAPIAVLYRDDAGAIER